MSGAYHVGNVVQTLYGIGVIVQQPQQEDCFFKVRLWRLPGKSIASAALATVQPCVILRPLPVAPGMVTSLVSVPDQQVLVHSYLVSADSYLVSYLPRQDSIQNNGSSNNDNNNNKENNSMILSSRRRNSVNSIMERRDDVPLTLVPSTALRPAPAAKFYPILESLVERGNTAAHCVSQLLQDETTQQWVQQTGQLIQTQVHHMTLTANSTLDQQQLQQWQASIPQTTKVAEQSIQQVLALVKNEQVTDLLEHCRDRLQQLVDTTSDISATTKLALAQTGIVIQQDLTVPTSFSQVQQQALEAIDLLLKETQILDDTGDLEQLKGQLAERFGQAFDSLSVAAKSDRALNSVFESITEKTCEWQEATGRIMQTRSASLFLEGASRLQARAARIFSGTQLQWAGEIGSKLTKSFTEGDAALAKLKSIELGDAVKNRLVDAIEVRSEAMGGLDGIIAGALASISAKGSQSEGQLRELLTDLRMKASTATLDANETLISVLSSHCEYQDIALLRVENALCMLENQFGDDFSPQDIAAIARGEGGTAKIFEPIAKRAMEQIDQQLDLAESNVQDKAMLEVLRRIRKILSGEMTLSSVMDEIVSALNENSVVAASETLMQGGERVLDALEDLSGHDAVNDAIKLVEKAGITRSTVMKEIEKLDVNELLDTAGSAVTDERARQKLLSAATDTALDFVLKILPSMPVPPYEGVSDGLVYHISNLSMEGFKVRKEDIHIELAGMKAAGAASSVEIDLVDNEGKTDVQQPSHSFETSEDGHGRVRATELLIIDVRNVSAILDNAAWSFEQTYMPYLQGNGMANVRLSGGFIRLQFELRRRLQERTNRWEPVLCLHDRNCSISDVELTLQGEGRLTWILNKLALIFKGPLRDYVVRTIIKILTNRSGWILDRMNKVLAPYWDLILRTAQLKMDNLVQVADDVVVKEVLSKDSQHIELVWRERLPLGMNLLLNDESGLLKVVDFPRGSQARAVCEKRDLNPDAFKGSTIIAVNGSEYEEQEDLFDALKEPGRPKTVRFLLAETEEAERLRRFVEGIKDDETSDTDESDHGGYEVQTRHVVFNEPGNIGIEFANALDNSGLVVNGFMKGPGGIVLAAEKDGSIKIGDLLVMINDVVVHGDVSRRSAAIELLETCANQRPLKLTFTDPYIFHKAIEKPSCLPEKECVGGPSELKLAERSLEVNQSKRVVIQGFANVSGKAEISGIYIGDHLVFVNGFPVGAGCRWLGDRHPPSLVEIDVMLRESTSYPIGLTLARPKASTQGRWSSPSKREQQLRDDEAETFCVTVDSYDQLGCIFDQTNVGDVVVADLTAVAGLFQRSLGDIWSKGKSYLSIESVNNEFVPSYASKEIVKNAISRSWKGQSRVELTLIDDKQKERVRRLAESDNKS